MRARTPSKPIRPWASRPTCATTGSARRSSSTWAPRRLRILTNNPKKIVGIEGYGLQVVERVPIEVPATESNKRYLMTKRQKMGHLFSSLPD